MPPTFTPEKFEAMINRRGRPVKWERGAHCPCQDAARRSPDENCALCKGLGYLYTEQSTFKATVLSITSAYKYAGFGEWTPGDAIMTFSATHDVGERDRITLTNAEERESDVLRRGKRDFLLEPNIIRIAEVRDLNRFYTEGIDFDRDGRNIVWKGQAPSANAAYTVLYFYRPVYVVWLATPQNRAVVTRIGTDGVTTEKRMPEKVALRRWRDFMNPGVGVEVE